MAKAFVQKIIFAELSIEKSSVFIFLNPIIQLWKFFDLKLETKTKIEPVKLHWFLGPKHAQTRGTISSSPFRLASHSSSDPFCPNR